MKRGNQFSWKMALKMCIFWHMAILFYYAGILHGWTHSVPCIQGDRDDKKRHKDQSKKTLLTIVSPLRWLRIPSKGQGTSNHRLQQQLKFHVRSSSTSTQNLARCHFSQLVKIDVEMTAPELADTSPDGGRVPRTVDALEHSRYGTSGQFVLVAVLRDEVPNVRSDRLLLVACLLVILNQIDKYQINNNTV